MNKENIDYTSEEFWGSAPKDATHFYPEDHEFHASFWEFSKSMQALQCWVIYPDKTIDHHKNPVFSRGMGSGIPRPTTFTKPVQENAVSNSDWFVDGKRIALPPVGTICEYYADEDEWRRCEIVAHKDGLAVVWVNEVHIWTTRGALLHPIKKELTIQEKILEAWKAQGIDFAYDNENTQFSFKVLVDFVVNNFDVREKE